ncbi:TIGR04222 domain-containing membrane protein [Amycolatopsis sp. cg5]|uniref:TIGR04222 domain-containing membrane protein n=1 Tax=Amycolatopsis sp. cg5 TaxID=3238802 RepID=UPI003525DDA6
MENPWGISGPAFIQIYIGLLVAPLVVRVILGIGARLARPAAAVDTGRALTVYEYAYLAGGQNRVIETVIAALVERGLLRVSSNRKIRATGAIPGDPLEAAVVRTATGKSTLSIMVRMSSSAELRALATDLERRGLVVPNSRTRTIRKVVFWLYLAVLAVGFARWVNGLSLNRPVGWLTALVIVALVATLIARVVAKRPTKTKATAKGQSELSKEKSRTGQHNAVLAGAAGLVAVGGMTMYPDPALSAALMVPVASSGGGWSSSDSGSSFSSSCGSSGGSSSCGGGGSSCGGGGGCGG